MLGSRDMGGSCSECGKSRSHQVMLWSRVLCHHVLNRLMLLCLAKSFTIAFSLHLVQVSTTVEVSLTSIIGSL